MKSALDYNLVHIRWIDAYGANSQWTPLDEIETGQVYIDSVGWMTGRKDGVVTLVPHVGPELDGSGGLTGCGDMSIPESAIPEVSTLMTGTDPMRPIFPIGWRCQGSDPR